MKEKEMRKNMFIKAMILTLFTVLQCDSYVNAMEEADPSNINNTGDLVSENEENEDEWDEEEWEEITNENIVSESESDTNELSENGNKDNEVAIVEKKVETQAIVIPEKKNNKIQLGKSKSSSALLSGSELKKTDAAYQNLLEEMEKTKIDPKEIPGFGSGKSDNAFAGLNAGFGVGHPGIFKNLSVATTALAQSAKTSLAALGDPLKKSLNEYLSLFANVFKYATHHQKTKINDTSAKIVKDLDKNLVVLNNLPKMFLKIDNSKIEEYTKNLKKRLEEIKKKANEVEKKVERISEQPVSIETIDITALLNQNKERFKSRLERRFS
jgi:hypothetical protein